MTQVIYIVLTWLLSGPTSSLTVELDADKPLNGTVFIAIYASEEGFLEANKAFYTHTFPATDGQIMLDLPNGSYAITVFIDQNNNQTLDKNLVGYPTEPFGFSKNPSILLGPPGFSDALIQITADTKHSITLR